jgi:hypothetical protein
VVVGIVCAMIAVASCVPVPARTDVRRSGGDPLPALEVYADRSWDDLDAWYPLEGDEGFSVESLSHDQRLWHARLFAAIDASRDAMVRRAERDDAYDFGRWLYQYNHALLMGLRMTGDLRFLDEVDLVAEGMRRQLRDGWCGGVDGSLHVNVRYGTVSVPDGYLNFRLRGGGATRDYCRDTGDLNEGLTHGHLAMVMYAYHANRHLESPAGIDYGERADFWLDYLRNHFEAKWRERSNTTWPDMDFLAAKFCHTYHQMLLYYYFVGRRLASEGSAEAGPYLSQAMRMSDGMFEVPYVAGSAPGGFVEVDTSEGPSVVYSFGSPWPGDDEVSSVHLEACPTTYARYMLSSVLTLRMEAFGPWDDDIMARIATGLASFVVDTLPLDERELPFAAGVSGEEEVEQMAVTTYRDRFRLETFAITPFAAYVAWDDSDRLRTAVAQVYTAMEPDADAPQDVFVPAGMLVLRTIDPRDR